MTPSPQSLSRVIPHPEQANIQILAAMSWQMMCLHIARVIKGAAIGDDMKPWEDAVI